jgi:predicted Zn-dependent peptidase
MTKIVSLDSKIRLAVDKMKDVETVSVGVFVNTGSRNEDEKNNGISHFLEHMAFKGTKKRTAKQIAEEFEGIGGRINAYTSKEKTVYYAKVLKKHAEFAVEFLSDILQNSTFDKTELEKERGVILQEIAMTNDTPDDIIFDYLQETAFADQSLGRSILGPNENIKKFTPSDFKKYIKSQYNFSDMAISAAGNVDENQITKWSEKYFTNLGKAKIKKAEKAKYIGGDFRKEKKLEQINITLAFEGVSYHSDDFYKTQILSMILGSGMSSRLFQEVRENLGLAYSIYSFNQSFDDCGLFTIYSATAPDKANDMLAATIKQIKKITEKITDEELSRVRNQFEASLLMSKESTTTRMQKAGNNILSFNKIISDKDILNQVKMVKKNDISEMAEKIFFSKKPTLATLGKIKNLMTYDKLQKALS